MNKLMIGLVVASLQISYAAHAAGASSEAAKAGEKIRGAVEGPRESIKPGQTGTKLTAPGAAADPSAYSAGAVQQDATSHQVAAPTNHGQVTCPMDSAISKASARTRESIQAAVTAGVGGDACASNFSGETVDAVAAIDEALVSKTHQLGLDNIDRATPAQLKEIALSGVAGLGNFYHISNAEAAKREVQLCDASCDVEIGALCSVLPKGQAAAAL